MISFKKYFLIIIISLLSKNVLGDSLLQQKTPDGRFGTSCYTFNNFGGKEVCEVPFVRLLTTPEKYDGKIIRVTGYLINVHGSPVLFANKSSFDSGVDMEGLALKEVKIPQKIKRKINSGIWPVYIVGKFNAKYDNDDKTYRLGRMEEIMSMDTWN